VYSSSNLELLETLSNKAKMVKFDVREENVKLMKEEYHANFKSVTEHLIIESESEIPLQMVNIF
jgi:hypothetical protein